MPTKYVRIVPSSGAAGSSLSDEIAQAFDRIRERAYAIYDNRLANATGSDYEDWLQAERDLFEVPEANLVDDGDTCRLLLQTEAAADRTRAELTVSAPLLAGVSRSLPQKALTRLYALCQTGAEA